MTKEDDLPYTAAGSFNPWLIAVVVSIATFMEVLDTTIANVALRNIAGSLAASEDESTYILTSYLVSNAIIVPISGWLTTLIGRKRFYMICVGLFTFSSVMCATAGTLWEMIFWRIMQGFGGGGLAPVEQSIFADSFPLRMRPQAFALYGLTIVFAPAIGPILGGWLTDAYSWHWVFLINLPVGTLSLFLVWFFVSDSPATTRDRAKILKDGLKIDYFGFLLVVFGFGALQILLDRFQREDGFSSTLIMSCAIISGVSLSVLMLWELYHPQPVMNVRLFRYRSFSVSCVLMLGVGFTLIAATQILPQMAQSLMGYDATTSGLTLGLAGIVTIILMPLSGILTGRVLQPRVLASVAFAGTAYALWYASRLDLTASFWNLSTSRVLQAMWLPFLFIPISSASLVQVPQARNADASAILNLMRNLGGSIGVSYITNLLAWRSQFHQARLVEHLTPYTGTDFRTAVPALMQRVAAQAAIMTYNDLFIVLALVAAAVVPIAFLLPKLPKGAAVGSH
jgi:MFS transporter, DHA2 family, multidrug resistance protein